ncbi:MAG TPA: ATP-grasp fold amidoligase family protein [Casimicrobiaceae bacterium]|nr:ATP-grasp fold amidoligase family protein [Casimicrobiaceae bacterium]
MPQKTSSRRWRQWRIEMRRRLAARFVGDRVYLAGLYRKTFGRRPDLDHPSGFNEKILVKILTDRRQCLTLFADRLRVRDYVRQRTPEVVLPRLYGWSERAESLPYDLLPESFVLKANHGSGWVRIVAHRSEVGKAELVRLARKWLASDFTIVGREWAYRDVRRAVYAEELLRDDSGGLPPDFKLFAFDGEVRLIQVDRDRDARHTQVLYDPQWRPIEGVVAAAQGAPLAPPATLVRMVEAAQALAAGIDFLRVDFYEVAGRVVFGELTNYPNKGLSRFQPVSLDGLLGSWLTLAPTCPVEIAYRPETFSGR